MILCSAGMAACSSAAQHSAGPAEATSGPITLPLDRYVLTDSELTLVDRAKNTMIARCMGRAGFSYPVRGEPVTTPGNTRRYGLSLPDSAARFGYRPPPQLLAGRRWTAVLDRYVGVLDRRGQAALFGTDPGQRPAGVPVGGCAAAADALTPGGSGTDPGLVERLAVATLRRAAGRPEVLAAQERWSQCMATAGFRYASPEAAAQDPRWSSPGRAARPSGDEVRTARTDVDCKLRTGYLGRIVDAETAEQRQAVAANAASLARVRSFNDAEVRLARQALLTTGPDPDLQAVSRGYP